MIDMLNLPSMSPEDFYDLSSSDEEEDRLYFSHEIMNIKGFETANYIQMVYVGNKTLINSLDITISRDESILRHLTTKVRQLPQILD